MFERVANTVGEVIGGVDAPTTTGVGVGGILDPVGDQVIHIGIAGFKVHLKAESHRAFIV